MVQYYSAFYIERAVDYFSRIYPDLWSGNWQNECDVFSGEPEYTSQSEADHGLARQLAYWFANEGISDEELPTLETEFQRVDGKVGWGYPDELSDYLAELRDAFR